MSNDRPTTELPVIEHDVPAAADPAGEDPIAVGAGGTGTGWGDTQHGPDHSELATLPKGEPLPAGELPPLVDDDEEWLSAGPARGFRLRAPTAVLLALLVAAGAFWGGAVAEKHHNPPVAAAGAGARGRTGFEGFGAAGTGTGATGETGGTGAAAAAGGVTEGTVAAVKGDTLSLTETSGTKVTVKITSSTTVSRTGMGSAGSPKVGDSAVVVGSAGSGGTITATRVTLTQKGVTAARGGFGGEGFGGTGATFGSGSAGASGFGSGTATSGGAGSSGSTGSSGDGSTFGFGAGGSSAG